MGVQVEAGAVGLVPVIGRRLLLEAQGDGRR